MKKKQFDSQTAKKIINEYAEKINLLSRENAVLKKQLEDSKISLKINKDILYSHIKSKKNVSEECNSIITDLKKENERLNNKISWLFTEKAELAKKLYKLEDSLNEKINQETMKNENEKTEKFLFENKLKEKDNLIIILKKQLENYKRNNKNNYSLNNGFIEIYIGDPNIVNTEMNNELEMSRALIKKYIYLMQGERENARKLNNQIQSLQEKISKQKANSSFITPTPKLYNLNNNKQIASLSEILNQNEEKEEDSNTSDNSDFSGSFELEDDKENYDLSLIKNKNIKENNRNKTCEKVKKLPKLNFNKVEEKYSKPVNIKVIGFQDIDNNNINNKIEEDTLLNQRYKSQIEIYKKSIKDYKEKLAKFRKKIRSLNNKNSVLVNTLKMYINNNLKQNKNENDISMTPCVNDASGLSTNSIIFKGGTLENINKLNEINKKQRLNQIMNITNNNNEININIVTDNNNLKKEDPLDNIIIKDNYSKMSSKETNKSSTKNSNNN